MNYQQQAEDFAKKHAIKLDIIGEDYRPFFHDDKEHRSVFRCVLKRKGKQYTFDFGQSILNAGVSPSMYDVLSCLTKSDPESFENFCGEFGYDEDSRKAERTYKAVVKEWEAVERLFSDILDELYEIQ